MTPTDQNFTGDLVRNLVRFCSFCFIKVVLFVFMIESVKIKFRNEHFAILRYSKIVNAIIVSLYFCKELLQGSYGLESH